MKETLIMILVLGSVLVAPVPVTAQNAGGTPTPAAAVKRACDAAGGLDAFMTIGVVELHLNREEVTQDGHKTNTSKTMFFLAPGPIPGRTEDPQLQVIAGDDGSGGWATVGGQVDSRPSTAYMVKRLLTGELFPLLLPFSLTWEGVTVTDVVPAELAGQPVWRLKVELNRSFFHTPQISTSWTVDLDRMTFALAQAQSPATDLGKGMLADGMKFSWGEPVKLRSVALPGYQRIVGLNEAGREKSHSRIDRIVYKLLKPDASSALFSNPIPPEQRPQLPVMQPPPPPQGKPGG